MYYFSSPSKEANFAKLSRDIAAGLPLPGTKIRFPNDSSKTLHTVSKLQGLQQGAKKAGYQSKLTGEIFRDTKARADELDPGWNKRLDNNALPADLEDDIWNSADYYTQAMEDVANNKRNITDIAREYSDTPFNRRMREG